MVIVTVTNERPLYLYEELLCSRSRYFQASLQGDFAESATKAVTVSWEENAKACVLFLTLLGSVNAPEEHLFNQKCVFRFIRCCAYFQVTEEFWTLIMNMVSPVAYQSLSKEQQAVWVRQIIPFAIMRDIVLKLPAKMERIICILEWFNEKNASSNEEKRNLQTCDDYFLMQELISSFIATPQKPKPPAALDVLNVLFDALKPYPIGSKCLDPLQLINLVRGGGF